MECVRKSVTISSSLLREMQLEYICIWPLVHGKFWQRLIDLFGLGRTENDEIFFVAVAGLSCSVDFPVLTAASGPRGPSARSPGGRPRCRTTTRRCPRSRRPAQLVAAARAVAAHDVGGA